MLTGFYMDESGNNGFADSASQPVLCFAGVLIPNDVLTNLEKELNLISHSMRTDIENEIKGLRKKDMQQLDFFANYEIHGKPFVDGDELYSKITSENRFKYLNEILDLLDKYDIKVFASVIHKQSYQNNTNETKHINMHSIALSELFKELSTHMQQSNQNTVVICDKGKKEEIELLLTTIRQLNDTEHILNDILDKNSIESVLVQLADIVTFITTVFFRNQYGHTRKNFNDKLVSLYEDRLISRSIVWKYN